MIKKLPIILLATSLLLCGVSISAQVSNKLSSASLVGDKRDANAGKVGGLSETRVPMAKGEAEDSREKSLKTPRSSSVESVATASELRSLTGEYKVAAGDVLDIHIAGIEGRESTLFSVSADGLLDYPLVREPLQVAGLTPEKIGSLLKASVKMYELPSLSVSVREYASHFVIVIGMVSNPGSRALRREAVPLYVILSEAEPRQEATTATIVRSGRPDIEISLSNQDLLNTLVTRGDVIKLSGAPVKSLPFFFVGGEITSPGQKDFYEGMTLTQAVLVAGGILNDKSTQVKVSRQGLGGLLATTMYDLTQIYQGKIPDPSIQAGDRLEVQK